jgi:hypothetical protein
VSVRFYFSGSVTVCMKLDFTLRLCVESDKEVLHLVDERSREWKKGMERQGN